MIFPGGTYRNELKDKCIVDGDKTIIDSIETKLLLWYGHVGSTNETRCPPERWR